MAVGLRYEPQKMDTYTYPPAYGVLVYVLCCTSSRDGYTKLTSTAPFWRFSLVSWFRVVDIYLPAVLLLIRVIFCCLCSFLLVVVVVLLLLLLLRTKYEYTADCKTVSVPIVWVSFLASVWKHMLQVRMYQERGTAVVVLVGAFFTRA